MPESRVAASSPLRGPQRVTWVAMLNRTLFLGVAVLVGCAFVMTSTVLLDDSGARKLPGLWVLLGTQALLMAAFIGYSRRQVTNVDQGVALVITFIGVFAGASLAWSDWKPTSAEAGQLLPALAMGVQLVTISIIVRRARWVVVAMLAAVAGSLWLTYGMTGRTVEPETWVVPSSFATSTVILLRALRNAAVVAGALADRRREVRARVVAHSNAEVADDEGRRLIHDRVIGALTTIEAGRDPETIAEACAEALDELTLLDPSTSVAALRESLATQRHPEVHIGGDGWRLSPPPRVVTALRQSASEAIRNASLHGKVDEVTVLLSTSPIGQVVVEVRDAGGGFDPAHTPGFGLSESIVARMGQVGGQARIESSPGMGTAVQLAWPHQSSLRTPVQSGVLARGGRGRLYLRVMTPSVIALLYLAIYRAPETTHPYVSMALGGLTGAAMLVTAWFVGRHRPSWPVVLLMASVYSALTVAALSIAPERALVVMGTWVITGAGVAVGAASLEARLSQAAFLALAESGTIAWLAYLAPHVRPLEPAGALIVPIACASISYVVGSLLRHGSRMVAVQDALANAELEEVGWVESAQVARQHYADQLQTNVAPFLRFNSEDRPTSTPALRTQAAELIGQCRDLLAMSDTTPTVVREAALVARKQGIRVAIRDAPSVSPVAWALLAAALKHCADAEAVTLIPARGTTPARVTVIPRLTASVEAGVHAALEGQTLWIEHTDVTTSFILVSPEWGASTSIDKDLGSTS